MFLIASDNIVDLERIKTDCEFNNNCQNCPLYRVEKCYEIIDAPILEHDGLFYLRTEGGTDNER